LKGRKYFEVTKYESTMVNPTSTVMDLWNKCNGTKTKNGLEYVSEDPKGKKEWRRVMISKLEPEGLARHVQNAVTGLDEEAKNLRRENSFLHDYVQKRAIKLHKAFRVVHDAKEQKRSLQHDAYAKGGKGRGDSIAKEMR
jgi:hypothetical protein